MPQKQEILIQEQKYDSLIFFYNFDIQKQRKIIIIQSLTFLRMFWPFGLNSFNQFQNLNSVHNHYPFISQHNIVSHQFNYPYASGVYDFSQNYFTSFPQNDDIRPNNLNSTSQRTIEIQPQAKKQPIKQEIAHQEESSLQNPENSKKSRSSSEGTIRLVRFRRRRKVKRQKNKISHNCFLRNDTKNIPKNYGKAMLTFIQKNTRQLKQLLEKFQVDLMDFMMAVKGFKSKINTIHDLRQMWGEDANDDSIKKCIRIVSYHFMRKKCLPYIFNSRIKNCRTHIKYRKKIMEGIAEPDKFTKIKDF